MTGIVLHLPSARSLATLDLAVLVGPRTRLRGTVYALEGRVEVDGGTVGVVTACVEGSGSQPYRVAVGFGPGGLQHECSCPAAAHDEWCKHLVAVVLTVTGRAEPAAWAERAHEICDAVDELLDTGRSADVLRFCEEAAELLERSEADLDDPAAVAALAARLGELHLRAGPGSANPGRDEEERARRDRRPPQHSAHHPSRRHGRILTAVR